MPAFFYKKKNFLRAFAFIFVLSLVLLGASQLPQIAGKAPLAQALGSNLGSFSGYAWSDNLGWISLSGSGYGVVIQSDGTLAGYAWADPHDDVANTDNIGWISFNAADTASCGSVATLSGTTITGWAKVLSADNNGWDGCISLNGSSPAYGLTLSSGTSVSGTLDGYAWADSTVGGWISFNCDTGGPTGNNICATNNYAATYITNTPPPPSDIISTFSVSPSRVRKGSTASINYNVTSTGTCTITGSDGSTYPVTADAAPHAITTNAITQNTLYTLACPTVSASASVGIAPSYIER